jgi:hypothetical protein
MTIIPKKLFGVKVSRFDHDDRESYPGSTIPIFPILSILNLREYFWINFIKLEQDD